MYSMYTHSACTVPYGKYATFSQMRLTAFVVSFTQVKTN